MSETRLPVTGAALAQALLKPRSVALVGASDDVRKTAGRPLQYLRQSGFAGAVYPVNAQRQTVQGEPAWPNLRALPEVPEHVFVMTPTASVLDTVRDCVALGVPVVTVLASGFSEAGSEGAALEQELKRVAREGGVRLLGPSSLGVVHPATGLVLTANAAFAEPELPQGRTFVASQSGSMIGALVSHGKARGMGFAGLVSVGSEADLSAGEICLATLDDPSIDSYVLFLESLHDGAALRAFAHAAAQRGKPVVAYKLGRSAAAAEMAATHTGALAGEDDVAQAFLQDLGIARVSQFDTLLEAMPLARRMALGSAPATTPGAAPETARRKKTLRVGVVTTTGGGAAMVVDQLGVRGIEVQPPSADTLALLAAAQLPCSPGRVLDLTLAGTRYDVMKPALDILLEAPEFDLIVTVVGSSARFQPELAVKPILDSARHSRPLVAMLVPHAPLALAQLTEAQVPCFKSPETCADAIAALAGRRQPTAALLSAAVPQGAPRALSEAQAYGVLQALHVPHAPVLRLPLVSQQAPALPFDYPVVAKVCSDAIAHKTEVGGVVLNIQDAQGLANAFQTLRTNLAERAPGVPCDEVLVQPMRRGLGEVLIGYRIDPQAGPIIMLAAGGIWAEVMQDRSLRLAPVTLEGAREMIDEVRSLTILRGARGSQPGDLEALAQAVSALSQLAVRPDLQVLEAEVNPLLVLPQGQGVLAVDALVLQASTA
ncbi:acetate--CoA ligase family protein [Lampropedia puyangensis]|uniref:Acetate--CoA ligase family protein n=1 Tax=Lampropedia puyangensis TaxID=1330072 RepID=A0A4S8ENI7_9BURK|nr:acetate--CoA ligase family protein [Lampropedia puyangensis]THT96299.1 acetate--CoA ligase family protein [Lampropedia puyangensis]